MFCQSVSTFAKNHHIAHPEKTLIFPKVKIKRKNKNRRQTKKGGGAYFKIMGIDVQSVSDQNWVKHTKPKKNNRQKKSFEHHGSHSIFSSRKKGGAKKVSLQTESNKEIMPNTAHSSSGGKVRKP